MHGSALDVLEAFVDFLKSVFSCDQLSTQPSEAVIYCLYLPQLLFINRS